MRVFKFGGASVKHADAVRNVGEVLKNRAGEATLVVISAMGKTTNSMESLVDAYFHNKKEKKSIFKEIKKFHEGIMHELLEDENVFYEVDNLFIELECIIEKPFDESSTYDQLYDRIVPFGELISTKIVSTYLSKAGFKNRWIDARNFIITTSRHRSANVIWETSVPLINNSLKPLLEKQTIITQGFIGRNENHENTTLGREGSDYSAAIFAYALDATSVTIWKDVEGVMNADPKHFKDAVLIDKLSYNEAIELAYYGASVIHPKTIQPLKSKGIPLYVKSFIDSSLPGTTVLENKSRTLNDIQCYIDKRNQSLLTISSRDFSFIVEDNLELIFSAFTQVGIQMNLMQNTAISFRACVNQDLHKLNQVKELLQDKFKVKYQEDLRLFTVFNYREEGRLDLDKHLINCEIKLEQKSNFALQLVLKDN